MDLDVTPYSSTCYREGSLDEAGLLRIPLKDVMVLPEFHEFHTAHFTGQHVTSQQLNPAMPPQPNEAYCQYIPGSTTCMISTPFDVGDAPLLYPAQSLQHAHPTSSADQLPQEHQTPPPLLTPHGQEQTPFSLAWPSSLQHLNLELTNGAQQQQPPLLLTPSDEESRVLIIIFHSPGALCNVHIIPNPAYFALDQQQRPLLISSPANLLENQIQASSTSSSDAFKQLLSVMTQNMQKLLQQSTGEQVEVTSTSLPSKRTRQNCSTHLLIVEPPVLLSSFQSQVYPSPSEAASTSSSYDVVEAPIVEQPDLLSSLLQEHGITEVAVAAATSSSPTIKRSRLDRSPDILIIEPSSSEKRTVTHTVPQNSAHILSTSSPSTVISASPMTSSATIQKPSSMTKEEDKPRKMYACHICSHLFDNRNSLAGHTRWRHCQRVIGTSSSPAIKRSRPEASPSIMIMEPSAEVLSVKPTMKLHSGNTSQMPIPALHSVPSTSARMLKKRAPVKRKSREELMIKIVALKGELNIANWMIKLQGAEIRRLGDRLKSATGQVRQG